MNQAFVLDSQCTLREAEAFKAALRSALDSSGDLVLDGGAVERIDTAGLQLLTSFAAHLRMAERRLVWTGVSDALRGGAERLGLGEALGLEGAA